MRTRKIVGAGLLTLGLATGLVGVGISGASAHVREVVATCDTLKVDATAYNTSHGPNHVLVVINGVTKVDKDFSTSFDQTFTTNGKGYNYHVKITASDDSKYSLDTSDKIDACQPKPCPTVTVTKVEQIPGPTVTKTVTATATVTAPGETKTVTAPPETSTVTVTAPPVTVTAPPVTVTLPPETVTAPPVTLPPVTLPPVTLPPVTLPPVTSTVTAPGVAVTSPPKTVRTIVYKTIDTNGKVVKVQTVKQPTSLAYTGVNVKDTVLLAGFLFMLGGLLVAFTNGFRLHVVRKH